MPIDEMKISDDEFIFAIYEMTAYNGQWYY